MIADNYGGGPVGVETLAAAMSEPRDAIEDIIEPYLIQKGLLQRSPRGRALTGGAYGHLGIKAPQGILGQMDILDEEDPDGDHHE